MAAATTHFDVVTSDHGLGHSLPQRIGRALWLPMWLMAFGFFTVGFVIGIFRADEIADGGGADTIAQLQHGGAGFQFLGFAALFTAIDFAIVKILGEFRKGGGEMQESTGRVVKTLKTPLTAKLFLPTMAMGMMAVVIAVILHFVFAADINNTAASLEDAEQRFIVLEGIRRAGITLYLFSFLLGLATIIQVLRFQSVRVRELVNEPRRDG